MEGILELHSIILVRPDADLEFGAKTVPTPPVLRRIGMSTVL